MFTSMLHQIFGAVLADWLDVSGDFMTSAWSGVVGNTLVLLGLVAVLFIIRYLPHRRNLREFFFKGRPSRLYIVLSHIRLAQGGALSIDGQLARISNRTIAAMEIEAAQRFKGSLLTGVAGGSGQPGLLSSLLFSEFSVEVVPSPLTETDIPTDGTIIAVGGPAFNAVSTVIERDMTPAAWFAKKDDGLMEFETGATTSGPAVGVVARVIDAINDRYLFYVAGPSEEATAASLVYLHENWRVLHRKFKERPRFAVAVRFVSRSPIRGRLEFDPYRAGR